MACHMPAISSALVSRGLSSDSSSWDAWRNDDGRWTVQLAWKAGRSDNVAHFRFAPGAHGGTVTAADDAAMELIDPAFDRPLRPVAPVAELPFEEPTAAAVPEKEPVRRRPAPRARRSKPEVPGWEDVLLGVRSTGTGSAGQG